MPLDLSNPGKTSIMRQPFYRLDENGPDELNVCENDAGIFFYSTSVENLPAGFSCKGKERAAAASRANPKLQVFKLPVLSPDNNFFMKEFDLRLFKKIRNGCIEFWNDSGFSLLYDKVAIVAEERGT